MALLIRRFKNALLQKNVHSNIAALAPILVALIFLSDFVTPPGYSHGVLYVLPVMLSLLKRDFRFLWAVTLASLLFNVLAGLYLGIAVQIDESVQAIVLWNRIGSASLIILVAIATAANLMFIDELDAKERRLTETARDAIERGRLLDIAAETLRFGGWSYDVAERRFSSSSIVSEIHGLPPGTERRRSDVLESYAPEFKEQISSLFTACLNEGIPYDTEIQIIRADNGQRVWVRATGNPVYDDQGKIIGINGSFSDLTETKKLQSEQERMSFRLQTLLEHAGSAIVGLNDDGAISFANSSAYHLLGIEDGSIEGKSFYEVVRPLSSEGNPLQESQFGVSKSLAEMVEVRVDTERFTTASGETIPVSYVSAGIRHPDYGGAVVVFEDISERIELEGKLRKTQRLKTVGQLTGGVAHDFNNLLTLILGNSDLMIEELQDSPELKEMAEEIYQCAESGAKLTHQLMSFAGQQSLAPEAHNLGELIRSKLSLLKRTIGEHISIKFDFEDSTDLVEVDARQFENAVVELCLNAARAMPKGGDIRIEISSVKVNGEMTGAGIELVPGRYVLLSISDTGCGIPEDELDRVFEPFFTTKDLAAGEGLGLSMVYGFVQQSGGRVSIYSEQGAGTVVRIYLPSVDKTIVQSESPESKQDDGLHGEGTVLVVDDNPQVLTFTERRLRKFGYTVVTARSGQEALDIIEQRDDIDLLFTDVIMQGGMNGKELVDKALEIRPELKFGFTSGFTAKALGDDKNYHSKKLISKPFSKEDLGVFIKRMMSEAPGAL
jgi:PAS domain S-box-containing protein